MTTSTAVQDYFAARPATQRQIADELVPLIEAVLPGAGAVWHGHPVWSLGVAPGKSPVCYVKAHAQHVTFGVWRGQEITDPSGRLEPNARTMTSVKLRAAADIDAELFGSWLRQARELEQPHRD
ncbi:DUF1801 domain-containing protein [Streptoalloteichus hindustanus]|uniref:YdhG-like domain-containing protein n=1 Tax=Streptoalloteichus hindustanus TaxID=2017 RepID=A0A1M5D7A2_STRHI|nr:DUF1801 domain-containing protein [Streptoalloteichus hindustanus]SHF62831.1 hypothetical protein SAMN05444320_104327 [Streptoalloteichus hindustanus]